MTTATALSMDTLPDHLRENLLVQGKHWIWQGRVNNKGYGLVYAKFPAQPEKRASKRAAHLVIYEILVGLVPDGLELDHTCPYPLCAFPECLEEVTHAENQRRLGLRQTHCRRGGHPRTAVNTYRNPTTGKASCRVCAREDDAQRAPRRRRKR